MFCILDGPDPPVPNVIGHFCLVVLNLTTQQFELIDSLRGPHDPEGLRVLHLMAKNIKKLWREARDPAGNSFEPKSIDSWKLCYRKSPRQLNT